MHSLQVSRASLLKVLRRPHLGKHYPGLWSFQAITLLVCSLLPVPPPPQPSGYNVVMEVAPTCVQLISYPWVTNPVLLSFTLSLHTHFHLQACPSHLPPWPTTHPSGMKLRCHLCWGVFPEFPDWISFLSSVLPYHPAVNDL